MENIFHALPGKGDVLHGNLAVYRITTDPREGECTVTFKAEILTSIPSEAPPKTLAPGQIVVVKIPISEEARIRNRRGQHNPATDDPAQEFRLRNRSHRVRFSKILSSIDRSIEKSPHDSGDFESSLRAIQSDQEVLEKLNGVASIPKFFDSGYFTLNIDGKPSTSKHIPFLVREYVEGELLPQYLQRVYGKSGTFSGVDSADAYFQLAMDLVRSVEQIHLQQVLHGNLCPDNIVVTSSGGFVFVGFEYSLFKRSTYGIVRPQELEHTYQAPEREISERADIYSLGGILYYLATGDDPPPANNSPSEINIHLVSILAARNWNLYRENCAVSVPINHCLYLDPRYRLITTHEILFYLGLISGNKPVRESRHGRLLDILGAVQRNLYLREKRDIRNGVFTLETPPNSVVKVLEALVGSMTEPSSYITLAYDTFWSLRNFGSTLSFLSMNLLAAQRGVTIRRVLVLRSDLVKSNTYEGLVRLHREAMERADGLNIAAKSFDGEEAYFTGLVYASPKEYEEWQQTGKHCALIHRPDEIVVAGINYSQDGLINRIEFRTSCKEVSDLVTFFRSLRKRVFPLDDYFTKKRPH